MITKDQIILGLLLVVILCCLLFSFRKPIADKKNEEFTREVINLRDQEVKCNITVVNIGRSGVLGNDLFKIKTEEKQYLLISLIEIMTFDVEKITKDVAIAAKARYEMRFTKDNLLMDISLSFGPNGDSWISYRSSKIGYGVIDISAEGGKKLECTISNLLENQKKIRENPEGVADDPNKVSGAVEKVP